MIQTTNHTCAHEGTVMLDDENICKFSNSPNNDNSLFAFQFIYETRPHQLDTNRSYCAFVCHLVTDGEAVFGGKWGECTLKKGDLFFCFPSLPFYLRPDPNFCYLYISFVGNSISDILKSMQITRENPVKTGYEELIDVWRPALKKCRPENLSCMAKSMLFYAFALFQIDKQEAMPAAIDAHAVIQKIVEELEQTYGDPDLSLEKLCEQYGYNAKYISRKFRETTGMSFSDYVKSCRIRHACVLLEETNLSVREISGLAGYRDALYFSRVFKNTMLVSPLEYRNKASKTKPQ